MAITTRTLTATQGQTPSLPRAASRLLYPAQAPNTYSELEPIAHYSSDGNPGGVTDVTAIVTPPFAQTLRTLQVKNATVGTLASMDAYMPLAYGPAATAGLPYTFTLRIQPGPGAGQRSAYAIIEWYNGATHLVNNSGTPIVEAASGWTQLTVTATAPATATHALVAMFMAAVPAGEIHYASAWQWTQTSTVTPYIGQGGATALAKAGARTLAPTQGQTPKLIRSATPSPFTPTGQSMTPVLVRTPLRSYVAAGQSMTLALAQIAYARRFAPTQAATPTMQGVVPPRTFTRTQSQTPSLARAPTRLLYPAQATNTYPELEPIGRYGSDSGNAGGVTDVTATVTPPFAQTLRTLQIKNMTAGTLVSLDAYIVTGWQADWPAATPGQTYTFTVWVQGAGGVQRNATLLIEWFNGPTHLVNIQGATVMEAASGWTRVTVTGTAPATTTHALLVVYISAVPVGEAHYASAWQFTQTAAPVPYFGQGGAATLATGAFSRTFAPTQSATPKLVRSGTHTFTPAGQSATPALPKTVVRFMPAAQSATPARAAADVRTFAPAGQSATPTISATDLRLLTVSQGATPTYASVNTRTLAPAGQAATPTRTATDLGLLVVSQGATPTRALLDVRFVTATQGATPTIAATAARLLTASQAATPTRASVHTRTLAPAGQAATPTTPTVDVRFVKATQGATPTSIALNVRTFTSTQGGTPSVHGVVAHTFTRTQGQTPSLPRTASRIFYPAQASNLYPELEVISHYSSDSNAGGVTDVTASVTPPFAQTQRTLQVKNGSAGTLGWMDAYRSWVYGPMVTPGQPYTFSVWVQPGPGAARRNAYVVIEWFNGSTHLYNAQMVAVLEAASGWTQLTISDVAPATATQVLLAAFIGNVPVGEVHYLSAWQFTQTAAPVPYFGQSGVLTRAAAALTHALAATQSQTPTVKRTVVRSLPTSQSASPFEGRIMGRSLTVAQGAAVSFGLFTEARTFKATQSQASKEARVLSRVCTVTEAGLATLGRTHARSTTVSQDASALCQSDIAAYRSASQGATSALGRATARALAVAKGQAASYGRAIGRGVRSTQAGAAALGRLHSATLASSQAASATLGRLRSATLTSTQDASVTATVSVLGNLAISQVTSAQFGSSPARSLDSTQGQACYTVRGSTASFLAAQDQEARRQMERAWSTEARSGQRPFLIIPEPVGTFVVWQDRVVSTAASAQRALAAEQDQAGVLAGTLARTFESSQSAIARLLRAMGSVLAGTQAQDATHESARSAKLALAQLQAGARLAALARRAAVSQARAARRVGAILGLRSAAGGQSAAVGRGRTRVATFTSSEAQAISVTATRAPVPVVRAATQTQNATLGREIARSYGLRQRQALIAGKLGKGYLVVVIRTDVLGGATTPSSDLGVGMAVTRLDVHTPRRELVGSVAARGGVVSTAARNGMLAEVSSAALLSETSTGRLAASIEKPELSVTTRRKRL